MFSERSETSSNIKKINKNKTCFNPTLGQIWTNPAVGLNFYITFLTQKLG